MEDDHRVWPEGPRHRRTPPEDTEPAWGARRGEEQEPPWNPQLRRTVERESTWESLPPSARLHGGPRAPGRPRRKGFGAVLAVFVATGLVAGLVVGLFKVVQPGTASDTATDATAGVSIALPPGWREGAVPPVTGFTSVIRDDAGAVLMARPIAADANIKQVAELYSQLVLQGDTVTVVADQPGSRSLRAEYKDVVNRPAYLRVMILTRSGRSVLLLGLLQPDDSARRQALDALMESVR